eukprot:266290-Prymnesium_polylepis.4
MDCVTRLGLGNIFSLIMTINASDSKTTHLMESHTNPIVAATEHTTNRMVDGASTTEAQAAETIRELHTEPTPPTASQPAEAEAQAPSETVSVGSTLVTSCSDAHSAVKVARILEASRQYNASAIPSSWRKSRS